MKVLYITHSCPYPPNKGERIRCFNVLKYLTQKHEVKLLYPSFTGQNEELKEHLRKYCTTIETVRMNPLLSKVHCGLGLLTRTPLTVSYFYSKRLKRLIANQTFDIALADCSSMAQYIMGIDCPKIVDLVDIDSDKWRLYAQKHSGLKSALYALECRRLREYESVISEKFNYCLVVSEKEKTLLSKQANAVVIPNGVDFQFFRPENQPDTHTLIFVGAMNYFPNIDGVMYFHREIFPLIQARLPSVKFVIAGMHPSPAIKRLADEHTTVTGYMPDIRSSVAQASVAVVPLRIAKGIQNKILEAMAMEVPVVATSVANSGINAGDREEILLADNPADFAQATIALLTDTALRTRIVTQAKQMLWRNFDWERNLQKLDAVLSLAASGERVQTRLLPHG
jgi:sugar transferase (PEP-CTERM/EpsH1 system associated)